MFINILSVYAIRKYRVERKILSERCQTSDVVWYGVWAVKNQHENKVNVELR